MVPVFHDPPPPLAVPKVVATSAVAPTVVAPKVAAPKVAAPKVAAPKVATPKVAAPKVAGGSIPPSRDGRADVAGENGAPGRQEPGKTVSVRSAPPQVPAPKASIRGPAVPAASSKKGPPPPHRFVLDLSKLPAAARDRFVACLAGRAEPKPLWSAPAAVDESWKFLLPAGVVFLVVMAIIGGDAALGWPWIAGWILAAVPLAVVAVSLARARLRAGGLGFAPGTYLFARDLIDARDGACALYNFDHITEARPVTLREGMKTKESEVDFVFGSQVLGFRMAGNKTAEFVFGKFLAEREHLLEGVAARAWDKVEAIDPFYKARQAPGWEQACYPQPALYAPFTEIGAKTGLGPLGMARGVLPLGMIAGIVAAPLLWYLGNLGRDAIAFSRARSANTVAAWKQYLERDDPRHYVAAKQNYLPSASLRAAEKAGTAEALRDFLKKYGETSAGREGAAALHKLYEPAAERIRAETSGPARDVMLAMLRWLEEHRTNRVAVRFGESSEFKMKAIDDIIEEETLARRQRNPIAPIGPSLSRETVTKREEQVLIALQSGLASIVSPDLVSLRKGAYFSGVVTGFDEPAITLACFAEATPQFILNPESSKLYLALAFDVEFNLVVPGTNPLTSSFQVTFTDKVPETSGKQNLYDGMLRYAYDEAQQRIAESLFPKHRPERQVALVALNQAGPAPVRPTAPGNTISATGFFISSDGYIATARHFTANANTYKIVTKNGLVDAKFVADDPTHDLAVLKVDLRSSAPLPVRSSETVKLGEPVATIGYPQTDVQGREPKLGRGEISSLAGMRDDPATFQISVPLQPGNSGGPLLDLNGNVVGVVVGVLRNAQEVNYAVKSKHLAALLGKIPELRDLIDPVNGAPPPFEDMVERARQATVLILGYP